jgi:hypothetical protein
MKREIMLAGLFLATISTSVAAQTQNFDNDEVGKAPKGFSTALTGEGKIGSWVIMEDKTAPRQPNVLGQTDMDVTNNCFPVCIFDSLKVKDVDVSVKFKPEKGDLDQAAGIIWRYKDKDNYYLVRAHALENNVVLFKVEKGKRSDLPLKGIGRTYGKKTNVPSGQWSTLRVIAKDNLFEVYFNGVKLYEVDDNTFKGAGKAGLWTKADSYTLFDDFVAIELK